MSMGELPSFIIPFITGVLWVVFAKQIYFRSVYRCDLAGSERLTKTKAEGVRLTEAKYLNTSLLELG